MNKGSSDMHLSFNHEHPENENLQAKRNLLYLEEVCYDPVVKLVDLLDKSQSSEEIKCLLLSVLSSGKMELLKIALIGSDTASETESTSDGDHSPSQPSNHKKTIKTKKDPIASTSKERPRPSIQRCQSERRPLSSTKDHASRSRHAPPQRTQSFNTSQTEDTIGRGSNSSRRRSSKPLPALLTVPRSSRDLQSRRRPSSNPRRPQRSGSTDVPRVTLKQNGSFNGGRRRARSNERDVMSQSHHCASRRSYKRKEALSLSLHGPAAPRETTDALQRSIMARLERSESDMKFDAIISNAEDGRSGVRGRSSNGCAASHDGVMNRNTTDVSKEFVPKSIDVRPETDVSDSLDDSCEVFVQFYPEGVKEISLGSKIKQLTGFDNSKHSADSKGKRNGGFFHCLARKGKAAKTKACMQKMKSATDATYDVDDSDLESHSDDDSVESFASGLSL
jgi:hypothetical protein